MTEVAKPSTIPRLRKTPVSRTRVPDDESGRGNQHLPCEAASLWVARNRAAMASYDAFVESDGVILEDLRTF